MFSFGKLNDVDVGVVVDDAVNLGGMGGLRWVYNDEWDEDNDDEMLVKFLSCAVCKVAVVCSL